MSQFDKKSYHAGKQGHSATYVTSVEAALQGADSQRLCGAPPRAEDAPLAGTGTAHSCPPSMIAQANEKLNQEYCPLHSKMRKRVACLKQGPLDLYRGLTCAILGTIPVAMIYFSTYELSKGFMERRGASGTTSHLASASMGAVMSAFVRVPTDTLRHQTQAYLIPNFVQVESMASADALLLSNR